MRPEVSDILDLELQADVSPWVWVLGTKLESVAREVCPHVR